jgi:hypothetical protein
MFHVKQCGGRINVPYKAQQTAGENGSKLLNHHGVLIMEWYLEFDVETGYMRRTGGCFVIDHLPVFCYSLF